MKIPPFEWKCEIFNKIFDFFTIILHLVAVQIPKMNIYTNTKTLILIPEVFCYRLNTRGYKHGWAWLSTSITNGGEAQVPKKKQKTPTLENAHKICRGEKRFQYTSHDRRRKSFVRNTQVYIFFKMYQFFPPTDFSDTIFLPQIWPLKVRKSGLKFEFSAQTPSLITFYSIFGQEFFTV